MPFKLKLKKHRQYNVVSKNVFIISVELLDNTVVECTLTSDSTGQDCLNNVCQRLNLQQMEYFGLRFASTRLKYQWVELDKPLKKQLDKFALQETYLYLGIMFYVDDVHQLHDEITRYQYFLQLKSDIINGRLPANQEQAVQLASYSLQGNKLPFITAEFGDHDPERHTAEYLKGFLLLPKFMTNDEAVLETLTEKIVLSHRNLMGLSQSAAEIYYINKAQQMEGYGKETFAAKDESGYDVQLSFSLHGVSIQVSSGQQATTISWKEIINISLHKRNLIFECGKIGQMLQFQMDDADVTKYLWKLCLLNLEFYIKGRLELTKNCDSTADFDKYTVKSSDSQHILNQAESFQRLQESTSTLYQERRQSAEEIRIPFSHSDTCVYEDYLTPYASGSQLNAALHGDSIYSVNSLGRSNPNFIQNFNSASNLSIPSGRSSNLHLRALLPSYRPAPDYETAVQHKYGNHSVSLGSLNGIPNYPQDLGRFAFAQQEQKFIPTKSYYHYKNFTDLTNLDSSLAPLYLTQGVVAQPEMNSNDVLHRTVDRLTPVSNLMLPPMHTYSTPELTTQGLHVPEAESMIIHHYQSKPPPPYPYNQRSSAPDLASQTMVGNLHNSNSLSIISQPPKQAINGMAQHQKAILEDVSESCRNVDSSSSQEEKENGNWAKAELVPRRRASSTQSAPDVFNAHSVLVGNLSGASDGCEKHFEKNKDCGENRSFGPMMVAAMNGLTLSRPSLVQEAKDESRFPKDPRRQLLESQVAEGLVFQEFEQILKKRANADYTAALHPDNSCRNRFKDVLPYEDNRVRLSSHKENKTGYINASHISITVGNRQHFYIAAQGPLANTVIDFWQMVWQQQSQLIVMLTDLYEQGRSKCFAYWPQDNKKLQFQEFNVSHKFSTKSASYTTSLLTLEHVPTKIQRDVWHIQYTDWPDHGCPEDVYGFLNFMEEIDSVRRHTNTTNENVTNSPIVVHCSAGVGRTGVTILADLMLYCVDYNEKIDVPKILTYLRQQRMLIVQTVAQYKFVYTVLIERLKNSRLI